MRELTTKLITRNLLDTVKSVLQENKKDKERIFNRDYRRDMPHDEDGNPTHPDDVKRSERDPMLGNPNARPLARSPDAEEQLAKNKKSNFSTKTGHEIDSLSRKSAVGRMKKIAGPAGRLPESIESLVDRLIECELFTEEEIVSIIEFVEISESKSFEKMSHQDHLDAIKSCNEKAFAAGHRRDDRAWKHWTTKAQKHADAAGIKVKRVHGYGVEI